MPDFAVILPAAGQAVRFGGDRNKLLCELAGQTILERSVAAFLARRDVRQIIIPTSEPMMNVLAHGRLDDPRIEIRSGGPSRAHSVRNALSHVKPGIQWVAVHDAARPLISQQLIDATLAAAVEHGAAAPALPVSLTIKEATGPLPAKVQRTVPRANLWAMQTPQIMRVADLQQAYDAAPSRWTRSPTTSSSSNSRAARSGSSPATSATSRSPPNPISASLSCYLPPDHSRRQSRRFLNGSELEPTRVNTTESCLLRQ